MITMNRNDIHEAIAPIILSSMYIAWIGMMHESKILGVI
jgi:hypothetical protein